MNPRELLLTASLAVLLVPPTMAVAADAPDNSATAKPAATVPASPESVLKKGMPADTVRQLLGKPEEVRPMPSPDTNNKVEVWVYTREVRTRVERVGFPSAAVVTIETGADGKTHSFTTPGPMVYHDVHTVIEDKIEVLLFNDHYLTHKVSRSERQLYQ